MAKYEFDIQILPKDTDKRSTFTSRLDIALAINGCRITAGEYMVTIERKSAAQVRSEAKVAEAEKSAWSTVLPGDPPSNCLWCGAADIVPSEHEACADACEAWIDAHSDKPREPSEP